MRRREFIGIAAGAVAAPLAAHAQQGGKIRRISILMGLAESDPQSGARIAAFRHGLRDLNWAEGNNLRLDIRYGAGDATRWNAIAAELVGLAPDLILGTNTPTMRALKQSTQSIPIVFAGLADPIGDGIVGSLARPGGNITGFSSFEARIAGKWLQLLKEIAPGLKRVAVVYNPDTAPHALFLPPLEAAAHSLDLSLVRAAVKDPTAIEAATTSLDAVGGLCVLPDIFTVLHRHLIIEVAARHRLPAVYHLPTHAIDGGLMAYGSDFEDQFQRAASYVDRILKGEKPADLPVQAPTKYRFVINVKTAKSLGLAIPPALRDFADEMIE